ncbi:metastasis-associated protein MTA3 [Eurytemora carolleeae]|uniref:metastasis-associated protein MTA3 n=1 Tax=Eurytemora carolleeae TaxID=1294199 RepID=UPI000C76D717|nr:metastasis-associated protein MTA3 [Eurytemora carolleeae]|eukprot:XP_023322628.1 metastasis-associated protein MTA3-like [Eurytemora affinis]
MSFKVGGVPPNSNSDNMYRVGDYVYFENSASGTYAVRRIEELNKTANGNVEARLMCFYRRSEVPASLVHLADKHHWAEVDVEPDSDDEDAGPQEESERAKHKQRELFLSRQIETLPATLIRGKCSVTLLSEVEEVSSYLNRDDAFFYSLVYDPHQKTLLADRGSIRIGSEFQAPIPPLQKSDETESPDVEVEEEMLWNPYNNIKEDEINQFIIIARSVGTFARALDCSSSVKQPSLHMSAAAASRDITVFHAYQALHAHNYDLAAALSSLVPTTGPVLCRDEMEDWSSAEANLFEEAIEKYGKDFNDIKRDFLPWKSMKNIIEYFFMWKTTDRYVQQKRIKALESENKLKQVYVPAYSRKSTRVTGPQGEVMVLGRDCDAYPNMTKYSWSQYKKFGRFVPAVTTEDCFIIDRSLNSSKLSQHRPGLIIEPGSPSKGGKTRAAFFLRSSPLMRASRRVNGHTAKLRHHARKPQELVDIKGLRTVSLPLLAGVERVKLLNSFKVRTRAPMSEICTRLGQTDHSEQDWLVLSKVKPPPPHKEFFPRPPKRTDGSYVYDRIPSLAPEPVPASRHQMLYKKRPYEEKPVDTPSSKPVRTGTQTRTYSVNQVAPKGKFATMARVSGGQKTVISWQDAPDDLFYRASKEIKKVRKQLSVPKLRKAARKPFRKIL